MSIQRNYKENGGVDKGDDFVETRCGIGSCRPSWLQRVNNPKILGLCICLYVLVLSFAVNGINNVNTTSYERRFELTSTQVGWISSAYDITAAVFAVIIGFCGDRRHKARILNVVFIIASLGSLCMLLPHFLTGHYQWGQKTMSKGTCNLASGDPSDSCDSEVSDLQKYISMLIIGQMMHGIAQATFTTVGFTLVDDSVPPGSASLYIGIFGVFFAGGPILGFLIGGAFLSVYVDYPDVPRENWEIKPTDPRWVGGWWMGFFFSAVLLFIFAIPFLFFGAELPTAKSVREERVSETHKDSNNPPVRRFGEPISLKKFPVSVVHLIRNPAFVCVAIGFAFTGLHTFGLATFLMKYILIVFALSPSRAAYVVGGVMFFGAMLGQFLGGFIVRRWQLKIAGTLRLMMTVLFIALITLSGYFIRCHQDKIVGWNLPYQNSSEVGNLYSACNSDCNCDTSKFRQVCDSDGTTYFSACLAGCTGKADKIYSECQCISTMSTNASLVSSDYCSKDETECTSRLVIFLVLLFVGSIMSATQTAPVMTVIMRVTHENERAFALGLFNFVARVLGTVPGPLIYGAVIDTTCGIWGENCGERGSCWAYDTSKMGTYLAILGISCTALAIACYLLAHKLYKPPSNKVTSRDANDFNSTTDFKNAADILNTKF